MTPAQAKQWRFTTKRFQGDIAKAIGVSRHTYARWERGGGPLAKEQCVALSALASKKVKAKPATIAKAAEVLVSAWRNEVSVSIPSIPMACLIVHQTAAQIMKVFMTQRKQPFNANNYLDLYAQVVEALV